MSNIEFAYPAYFYLMILIPLFIGWYVWRGKRNTATFKISGFENLEEKQRSPRVWLRHMLFVLRMGAVFLLIVVLARPQSSNRDVSSRSWQ